MKAVYIRVGDKVRSFDFAVAGKPWGRDLTGERAAYVEGTVVAIVEDYYGCDRLKILVERDVFGGKECGRGRVGDFVFPPVNGAGVAGSDDVTDSIELIS